MKWGNPLGCVLAALLALMLPAVAAAHSRPDFRVLVFTKTAGPPHPATAAGVDAIRDLARRHDFEATVSSDAGRFTDAGLARYEAVVFLNTSGDVLDDAQQAAFEGYVTGGGGLVAIHSAIETEPGWQFLSDALGARATGLSDAQSATVKVADRVHPSSEDLPEHWTRTDRWYSFDKNVRGFLHVLATADETTFTGGTMGFDHPIAWCQDFRGGSVWYTGRGGTAQAFDSDSMRRHLLGGIEWAAGEEKGDCGATVLSNFKQTLIAENQIRNGPFDTNHVGEPIGFDVLPDGACCRPRATRARCRGRRRRRRTSRTRSCGCTRRTARSTRS